MLTLMLAGLILIKGQNAREVTRKSVDAASLMN